MNFAQYANPYNPGFKKYLLQLIGNDDYILNDRAIDDFTKMITSEDEYKRFGALIQTIWESGFHRAIEQNLENYKKMGLKANIVYIEEKSG